MTPEGLSQLKLDEGCRLTAYPDPASKYAQAYRLPEDKRPEDWSALSRDPWTCGYGCTGPEIDQDTIWTQAEADLELERRVAEFEQQLSSSLDWFDTLAITEPVRADVVTNIAFNICVAKLMSWPVTLASIKPGKYSDAAD